MDRTVTSSVSRGIAFALLTAVITIVLAFGLAAATQGAQKDQVREVRDATELTSKYLSAIGCELAVPADPVTGRNPNAVANCFTAAGVPAPSFLSP